MLQMHRSIPLLPLISCAIPLTGAWHSNSSHIHFLLLTISVGIVLWLYARKEIGERDMLEGVRLYPTVGLLLILIGQALQVVDGRLTFDVFSYAWQGPFDNPAGLACFACCLVAIESGNRPVGKWGRLWHWAVIAALVVVVVLSQSRTGVLAMMVQAAIRLWTYKKLRWVLGVATILCMVGLFQLKSGSTSGRRFILQNTWDMICERPITGWGWHGFDHNYMHFQAQYFQQHDDAAHAWLADDVRHPMNEFLLWWVRFGIIGPVIVGGLLLWPAVKMRDERLKIKDKVTAEGWPIYTLLSFISTLLMFACLSYPLHYAFTWLFIGLAWYKIIDERLKMKDVVTFKSRHISNLLSLIPYLLFTVGTVSLFLSARLMQAERAAERHAHHRALRIYQQLAPACLWNPHFLYNYAHELYVTGEFEKALACAERCEQYWSRYDLTLLKGDIYRQQKQYQAAETTYQLAAQMCPNRFAPLEGLLTVYDETNASEAACNIARQVVGKEVKVHSEAVEEIRQMAQKILYAKQ